jgi:hypothetical protein
VPFAIIDWSGIGGALGVDQYGDHLGCVVMRTRVAAPALCLLALVSDFWTIR